MADADYCQSDELTGILTVSDDDAVADVESHRWDGLAGADVEDIGLFVVVPVEVFLPREGALVK